MRSMLLGSQKEQSKPTQTLSNTRRLMIILEKDLFAGAILTAVSSSFNVHLTSTAMKLIYFDTFDKSER